MPTSSLNDFRRVVGLRQMRFSAGLTQKQLAKKLGIDPKHLSAVERGAVPLSSDLTDDLVDLFGVVTYERNGRIYEARAFNSKDPNGNGNSAGGQSSRVQVTPAPAPGGNDFASFGVSQLPQSLQHLAHGQTPVVIQFLHVHQSHQSHQSSPYQSSSGDAAFPSAA